MKKRFSNKKKFQAKSEFSEEEKIRRRAIVFGFLTIAFGLIIVVWGIPLFIRLIVGLSNLKNKTEEITSEDIIPPPVPRLSFVPEATNSVTISISGFTEPKVKVKIKFNEEEFNTQADEEGKFLLEKLILKQGRNKISALAIDESGNQSEYSEPLEVVYDNEPPKLEIEAPQDGSATEEQNIEVKGVTEPGARVLVNNHLVIVDEKGKFNTKLILKEGGNEITVLAQDNAGNKTEKKISVTYFP